MTNGLENSPSVSVKLDDGISISMLGRKVKNALRRPANNPIRASTPRTLRLATIARDSFFVSLSGIGGLGGCGTASSASFRFLARLRLDLALIYPLDSPPTTALMQCGAFSFLVVS
jgi:hypothetical protein